MEIWNKAKGKERDALLWGDEVIPTFLILDICLRFGLAGANHHLFLSQVEYLVVTFAKDEPKVRLSLRQAEILSDLASDAELAKQGGCTADQQDEGLKQNK